MPPSAPADLTRAYLRRAINLHRFGNGLAQRTVAVLERARDDIVARLAKLPPTANARARLEQLYAQVTETIRSAYSDIHVLTSEQLAGMAQSQAAFTTASLNATLKGAGAGAVVQSVAVGETMLASIVETNPVRGALMADWWGKQAGDVAFKFRQQIQLGMAQSETVEQLIQRVRGQWAGGGYVGGVLSFKSQATRQAESLVRTAVAEVANRAQFETLRANDDITSTWQFVATLASNTCEECMALDGTVCAYDDPKAPEPPLHFSCRCVPVAVVDWEKLGIEPPAEGTRAAVDPTTGEGTVVPASTTYDDWLRAQPAEVQADILGAGKAELFSEGKITLRDLVRSDGSVVSLQQLQAQVAELAGAPPTPDVAPIREQFADVHPQTIGARLDTPLEVARGQEAAAAWAAQVTAAVQAQAAGAEAGVAKYGKASTAAKKAAATKATNKAMDAALAQAPTFAKIAPQQVAWLEDALAKGASIEQAILGYGIANPNAILLDDIAAWAKAYYGYGIPPGGALTPTIAKAAAPALTPAQKAAATKAAKKAATYVCPHLRASR